MIAVLWGAARETETRGRCSTGSRVGLGAWTRLLLLLLLLHLGADVVPAELDGVCVAQKLGACLEAVELAEIALPMGEHRVDMGLVRNSELQRPVEERDRQQLLS